MSDTSSSLPATGQTPLGASFSRRSLLKAGTATAAIGAFSAFGISQASPAYAANTTYYVAANGNDSANGTSPSTPWRTLAKVNATVFGPGDRILFRRGDTFTGQLKPQGSGSAGAPIVFSYYGSDAAWRPAIAGAGATPGTVVIESNNYLTIDNLEISNVAATEGYRSGIYLNAPIAGLTNITLTNLWIHDVKGTPFRYQPGWQSNGGITITSHIDAPATVSNLLVQDVYIANVDDHGVRSFTGNDKKGSTGQVFRRVTVENAGGNGIVLANTTGGLVEYCTVSNSGSRCQANAGIWPVDTTDALIQFNTVTNQTTLAADGHAYNCDWKNVNATFQYNFSYNNPKGFFQAFFQSTATIRYNVSQNDASGITLYGANDLNIYNNTIYLGTGGGYMVNSFENQGRTPANNRLTNNIFVNRATGGYISPGVIYNTNLFDGNHPASEPTGGGKIVGDALLSNPGTDTSRAALGYKLKTGSPALSTGVVVTGNGGRDYYGFAVDNVARPSIGAYNGGAV